MPRAFLMPFHAETCSSEVDYRVLLWFSFLFGGQKGLSQVPCFFCFRATAKALKFFFLGCVGDIGFFFGNF